MKISVAVMAHPKRRIYAEGLAEILKNYPFVNVSVVYDEKNSEWDTGSRALRQGVATGSDWHVVLQDDSILPPNFYEHLVNALAALPQRSLVSLYTGTGRPLPDRIVSALERARNCSWLKFQTLLWGVAIALPTAHITEMLDFVADRTEVYDSRIGWAYMRQALPVYYTNPSLVDHDDHLGSLLKQSALVSAADYEAVPRHAHNFIGAIGDKSITWNSRGIEI